jgi:hypothetical protein
MLRRTLVASAAISCLLGGFPLGAIAQASPRHYAVLSMLGDNLTVVGAAGSQLGSRISRNQRESFSVSGNLYDRTALFGAKEAISRAGMASKVSLHIGSSPELTENPHQFFAGEKATLPADVGGVLAEEGATHLLLITRFHDAAKIKFRHGIDGTGELTGLGFYIDRSAPLVTAQQSATGYLAAYAYLKVSLIDLKTSSILGQKWTTATAVRTAPNVAEKTHPWDVMSNEDKLKLLASLTQTEVERLVGELLIAP